MAETKGQYEERARFLPELSHEEIEQFISSYNEIRLYAEEKHRSGLTEHIYAETVRLCGFAVAIGVGLVILKRLGVPIHKIVLDPFVLLVYGYGFRVWSGFIQRAEFQQQRERIANRLKAFLGAGDRK